jgi:hypothetical protein
MTGIFGAKSFPPVCYHKINIRAIQNYSFSGCFIRVWNVLSHIKERKQVQFGEDYNAEDNLSTLEVAVENDILRNVMILLLAKYC